MREQAPLPIRSALGALARCAGTTAALLAQRRIHLPVRHVGRRLRFADGTSSRVYRETVVDRPPAGDPCVLVVEFRLRAVRGRGHAVFRWESLFNTPLFVGFPGFVSKLWLAHDDPLQGAARVAPRRRAQRTTPARRDRGGRCGGLVATDRGDMTSSSSAPAPPETLVPPRRIHRHVRGSASWSPTPPEP